MDFKNENKYWRDYFKCGDDDLEQMIKRAEYEFSIHNAPFRVIIKDNETGKVMFYREKVTD